MVAITAELQELRRFTAGMGIRFSAPAEYLSRFTTETQRTRRNLRGWEDCLRREKDLPQRRRVR